MERILVILVCIAMIVGLVGGGVLGYFISLPEIQRLENEVRAVGAEFNSLSSTVTGMANVIIDIQSEVTDVQHHVDNLNSTVETMENRSWHEVFSVEASGDLTSNVFHLKGKEVRATWIFSGLSATAELTIVLYFENGTAYGWWGDSGTMSVDNAVLDLAESGNYFVEISSIGMIFYYVAVHDY
ncbi:MAG: hypothetical protein JSV05_05205, partial [Candidatus Bathyarchaeota archaeon]